VVVATQRRKLSLTISQAFSQPRTLHSSQQQLTRVREIGRRTVGWNSINSYTDTILESLPREKSRNLSITKAHLSRLQKRRVSQLIPLSRRLLLTHRLAHSPQNLLLIRHLAVLTGIHPYNLGPALLSLRSIGLGLAGRSGSGS
jgi:hypothetical protein